MPVTLLAALAAVALTLVAWDDLKVSDGISSLNNVVAAVAYATLGVLIIRRAANLIGWIMLAVGAGIAFFVLASTYAVTGVAAHPGTLPAARLAGTLSECSFSLVVFLIAFMLLLFPTGKLPSPRWRPVAAAGFLMAGLTLIGLLVTPRLLQLPAARDGLHAALEDLRDLARGIYPPLLADQGLVPALQAQAHRAALPVEIEADGVGRFPQDTEAAVYFCTLEALQNIAKYANASRATVGLSCSGGTLRFTITDDGTGFDTASTRNGTGLQGMADRLAALGGTLQVHSQPGRGTTLTGRLPAATQGRS